MAESILKNLHIVQNFSISESIIKIDYIEVENTKCDFKRVIDRSAG